MGNLSTRLPEEMERDLEYETRISGKRRSELVREAIGEYLAHRERERFMAEMIAAAKALYSDPEAVEEAREIQEDFDAVDTTIDRLEEEERAAGIDPDEKWWD